VKCFSAALLLRNAEWAGWSQVMKAFKELCEKPLGLVA
jgi:hypothetical protein